MSLTTSSPADEFARDISRLPAKLESTARLLADRHHKINWNMRQSPSRSFLAGKENVPDFESIMASFTVPLTMLIRVSESIAESDDIVSSLDPEEDLEEIQHANGELFAAKSLYLTLRETLYTMEEDRLNVTEAGDNSWNYFYAVEDMRGPVGRNGLNQFKGKKIANGLRSGQLMAKSLSGYPNTLMPATTTKNFFLQSMSPALSATAPPPPALI